MEGDVAPLPEIADLAERYGARLMVDEAHGLGVLGARGAGASELLGVEERVDLRMATFSKSLASCGGVIAGPADVIDFLRIQSRPFLFTASGVPAAVGAALAATRICRSDEGRELFARVLENGALPQRRAARARLPCRRPGALPDGTRVATPIVPGARRRRLEGRAAVEGALRGRRLRQRRAPPGRPARRRAAAHERDGDARAGDARRARSTRSLTSSARSRPSTDHSRRRADAG